MLQVLVVCREFLESVTEAGHWIHQQLQGGHIDQQSLPKLIRLENVKVGLASFQVLSVHVAH